MATSITVRSFEESDLERLYALDEQMAIELMGDIKYAYSRQWLHACLCTHNPKWRAWTAVDGNSPIGFLMSQSRSKPSGRGKKRRRVCSSYIELFWVLVEPMYRHQGVATLMYQRLLAECTDSNNCFSNADEIRLHVLSDNQIARSWYDKLGFQPVQLKKDYPEPGFASWRMVKLIHPDKKCDQIVI